MNVQNCTLVFDSLILAAVITLLSLDKYFQYIMRAYLRLISLRRSSTFNYIIILRAFCGRRMNSVCNSSNRHRSTQSNSSRFACRPTSSRERKRETMKKWALSNTLTIAPWIISQFGASLASWLIFLSFHFLFISCALCIRWTQIEWKRRITQEMIHIWNNN